MMWEITGTRYDDEERFLENAIDMLPDARLDDSFQPQIWDGRIGGSKCFTLVFLSQCLFQMCFCPHFCHSLISSRHSWLAG